MKGRGPSLSVARRLSPSSLEHCTLHEHSTPWPDWCCLPMCRRFLAHASADRGMSSGGGCLPPPVYLFCSGVGQSGRSVADRAGRSRAVTESGGTRLGAWQTGGANAPCLYSPGWSAARLHLRCSNLPLGWPRDASRMKRGDATRGRHTSGQPNVVLVLYCTVRTVPE